jgi:predicted RND superfamily exporter protein
MSTFVSVLSNWIIDHPRWIVVLFLLFTAGVATGIGDIQVVGGPEQFSEDVDAYQTDEYVDETFNPAFEDESKTTLLLQEERNALSRGSLLQMLRVQQELSDRSSQRVIETTSPARLVATKLDPSARTIEDQIRAIRGATRTEIRVAVRAKSADPAFVRLVGEDFNPRSASTSATIGVVRHDVKGDDTLFEEIQFKAQRITASLDGDIRVFGSGITDYENMQVIQDSLTASIPAVIVLLVVFLAIAYRDPFDLALGVIGLAMSLVWTFGFVGLSGIPFTQLQIVLPPLLMAIGVDFGIHMTNRYREEITDRSNVTPETGINPKEAIRQTIAPLMVAFFMVMLTSVIGFSANVASGLSPIADFGIVAAVGITAVTLIFGVFLPAAKLIVERLRRRTGLPSFVSKPLGTEGSMLGRILPLHLSVTSRIPMTFLVVSLLTTGMAGYYGQDVGSSFEDEDMLPPEELPGYLSYLPGQMEPGTYTVTENLHFLEQEFETTEDDTVTIYLQGPFSESHALESIHRANEEPPSSFVIAGPRHAETASILTVIEEYAEQSPSFAALIERSDTTGNGVPNANLNRIYDRLLSSPFGEEARRYITDDYRELRIVYSVEADATDAAITTDAESMASDSFRYDAVETGNIVVFQRVSEEVYRSAIEALVLALILSLIFLTGMYYYVERRPALGAITLTPIVTTVVFLVATMRYLDIPFNMLTATILSVTVGIGVDYSIHVVHRFVEEFDTRKDGVAAARVTLQGTGGALFGTTLTTATAGLALHYLSITPILVQFGALIAFSVTYSFIASTVVLPVVLILWTNRGSVLRPEAG